MKRRLFFLVQILVLFVPMFTAIFFPSPVFAIISDVTAQQDRTILHAFYRCLDPNNDPHPQDLNSSHSLDSIFGSWARASTEHQDSLGGGASLSFAGGSAAVGYEIDSGDGNADCNGISITRAMRAIGKNKEWFWDQVYDFSHGVPYGDGSFLTYTTRSKSLDNLLGAIRNLMNHHDLGMGEKEKQRRLATAFWICAEPAPNPPDRQTTTYGGKDYQLRSDAPDEVSVGYDMESDNGKFKCSTLMAWGDKNEMAQALKDNPQGSTNGSTPGNAAGDDETQSCTGEGLSLGWILCPVVEAVSNFGNYVFTNYIQPMMENNPLSLKPDDPFYKSWQGFRFLGNILLIGSLLAVVYSQTRGGGG